MKKSIIIAISVICAIGIISLIINQLIAQPLSKAGDGKNPIPAVVVKIADKSCVKCHSEPGDFMALGHLNLSQWDKYSPEKQAAKAKSMCNMVSKDKMPPKKFRENHPDGVPTTEEIKTICDWAESLQIAKK